MTQSGSVTGMLVDDEGRTVAIAGPVRRVVSIVPSLTEAVTAPPHRLPDLDALREARFAVCVGG